MDAILTLKKRTTCIQGLIPWSFTVQMLALPDTVFSTQPQVSFFPKVISKVPKAKVKFM